MSLFYSATMSQSQLTLSSKVGFGVDSVFIDGVDVVFRRLQRSELRAQVTVLAAVGTSGAWKTHGMWTYWHKGGCMDDSYNGYQSDRKMSNNAATK